MGFLNTVKHFLGFESEDDYYDDDYYDEEETEDEESARVKRSSQQSAPKKTFSKVIPASSSRFKTPSAIRGLASLESTRRKRVFSSLRTETTSS